MKQYNYLIESGDSIALQTKIDELIQKNDFGDASVSYYDILDEQLELALEDLDTYGLFSSKKVVVIYNIDGFSIDNNKRLYDHLIRYIDSKNDSNLLIITSKKLNNTKKVTKDLKKKMEFILVDINPENFIKNKFKDYKVESGVIKKIIEYCSSDITKISNECDKLLNYRIDTKNILIQDVLDLVIKRQEDSVNLTFEFVRSLASKNKKDAIVKYHNLLENGVEIISLVGLIASQIRIMYQVKLLNSRGLSSYDIATMLGEKPYRITKTLEIIDCYSTSELLSIMHKLADIDVKMKTTDVDNKFLIELFILDNC